MPNVYDDFEKRFTNSWFSAGWAEIEVQEAAVPTIETPVRKDLDTLKRELEILNADMEKITQKQLRLSNLSKLYNQFTAS